MRWYWRETWLLKLIQINLFCNETLIITFISLWVRKAKCFQATPPWTGYERNTQASLQTQHTNVHTRKANTGIRLIYMGVSAVSKATNTHFEVRFLHRLPGKMHSFFSRKITQVTPQAVWMHQSTWRNCDSPHRLSTAFWQLGDSRVWIPLYSQTAPSIKHNISEKKNVFLTVKRAHW